MDRRPRLVWGGWSHEGHTQRSDDGLNGGDDLVYVRHGLVPITQPNQEMGYLIDHDFFLNERFAMTGITRNLTEYHQAAQRSFKLWITDVLHQGMRPSI